MNWTPRLTVAAVIEQKGRFLMVEEMIQGVSVINQPARHLENGETLAAAVIRETREETAWGFTPKGLVSIYLWRTRKRSETLLRFAFWGTCGDLDTSQTLDEGIIGTIWLTPAELLAREASLRSPLVLRAVNDYRNNRRYPLSLLTAVDYSREVTDQ